MRPFYLSKNKYGYYRVHFVDPVTGLKGTGKSTHSKDKFEATMIATRWLETGVPEAPSHSRAFNLQLQNKSIPVSIKSFVDKLSEADAAMVIELISQKYGISSASTIKNEKSNIKSYIEVSDKGKKHLLCNTLYDFWDYEKSEFIRRTQAHGHSISIKHAKCMQAYIKNYWLPYFGNEMFIE